MLCDGVMKVLIDLVKRQTILSKATYKLRTPTGGNLGFSVLPKLL